MESKKKVRHFSVIGSLFGVALATGLVLAPAGIASAADAWVPTGQTFGSAQGCDNTGRWFVNEFDPGYGLDYDTWRCSQAGDGNWILWVHLIEV